MKSRRRYGSEDSAVRAQLLDAAEQLMLDEGYAAVTSRRLAATIGVKQPLVYYYFRTMDELFLEVFRRMTEQTLVQLNEALRADQPLRALWNLNSVRSRTALTMEFLALANHRKVVQTEIASAAERFRDLEVDALTRLFQERGITPQIPPLVVTLLLTSLARGLVQESALGIRKGHSATLAFVEACLRFFEETGGALDSILPMIRAQEQRKPRASKRTRSEARSKRRVAGEQPGARLTRRVRADG